MHSLGVAQIKNNENIYIAQCTVGEQKNIAIPDKLPNIRFILVLVEYGSDHSYNFYIVVLSDVIFHKNSCFCGSSPRIISWLAYYIQPVVTLVMLVIEISATVRDTAQLQQSSLTIRGKQTDGIIQNS